MLMHSYGSDGWWMVIFWQEEDHLSTFHRFTHRWTLLDFKRRQHVVHGLTADEKKAVWAKKATSEGN